MAGVPTLAGVLGLGRLPGVGRLSGVGRLLGVGRLIARRRRFGTRLLGPGLGLLWRRARGNGLGLARPPAVLLLAAASRGLLRAGIAAERHAELLEQRERLRVVVGRGCYRNVEPADLVDRVVVDLREDDLLAHPQRVV